MTELIGILLGLAGLIAGAFAFVLNQRADAVNDAKLEAAVKKADKINKLLEKKRKKQRELGIKIKELEQTHEQLQEQARTDPNRAARELRERTEAPWTLD